MPEADRAFVERLADLRLRQIDLEDERRRIAARRDSEVKEQDRLRGLLQSVPTGSEAQRRYLEMVLAQLSAEQMRGLMQRSMSEEGRAFVARLADLRLWQIDLQSERGRITARRDSEVKEQDRLRGLLQSVPSGSEAQRRYLEMVLAREESIAAARAEDERLGTELAEVEAEVDAMLRGPDGGR
jgi:hypothetical protein